METPASMVRAAVGCMREGNIHAAVRWLEAARLRVSFARIHQLVNKYAGDTLEMFGVIDPALCRPLVFLGR